MKGASIFTRGQIWYWNDPIYGKKKDDMKVDNGESTVRYSRYCLIVQNTETIANNNSILVIPCSSKNNDTNDVKIPLIHINVDDISYAKCRAICPVSPKQLKNYICTLSESIMKEIDAEILKLLLPSITNAYTNDQIFDLFGINMELNNITKHSKLDSDVIDNEDQVDTINSSDNDNIKEIVSTSKKIHTKKSKVKKSAKSNKSGKSTRHKWNKETIREFMNTYEESGQQITSEKYNILPQSAYKYYTIWKAQLGSEIEESSKTFEKIDMYNRDNLENVPLSVSKFVNLAIDEMSDVLSKIGTVYEKINGYGKLQDSMLVKKINSIIYYSFMDFLFIRCNPDKTFYVPNVNEKSEHLNTWHFFVNIYNDSDLKLSLTASELISKYRDKYGDNMGIDSDYIQLLSNKLSCKLLMSNKDVDNICNFMKNYCGIEE